MKKMFVFLMAIALMALAGHAMAENALYPGCKIESSDGITLSLGEIYAILSENQATQSTHKWIVIDAEIVNFAVKELPIDKVLTGHLVYQDKYTFDAIMDFSQESIQPLVALKGRIIFEVPLLVAESEPGNFAIELTVNGKKYSFDIPYITISTLTMSLGEQVLEEGAYVPADGKIVFEWSTDGEAEGYIVEIKNWQQKKIHSSRQSENRFELDLFRLTPGDYYYFVVRTLPYFNLWTSHVDTYRSFFIIKPEPTPTPEPPKAPTRKPEVETNESNIVVDPNSTSESIRFVQSMLSAIGFLRENDVNGIYGASTAAAVRSFQKRVNKLQGYEVLEETGTVDSLTMSFLNYYVEKWEEEKTMPEPTEAPTEAPETGSVGEIYVAINGEKAGVDVFTVSEGTVQINWSCDGDVECYYVYVDDANGNSMLKGEAVPNTAFEVHSSRMNPGEIYTLTVGALPVNGSEEDIVWKQVLFMLPDSTVKTSVSSKHRQSIFKSPDEAIVYRTSNGAFYHMSASCSGMSGGKPYTLKECADMKACPKCAAPDVSLLVMTCEWVDAQNVCHVSDECPSFTGNYRLVPVFEAAKSEPVYCTVCSENFSE